jgi:hypothetical protein
MDDGNAKSLYSQPKLQYKRVNGNVNCLTDCGDTLRKVAKLWN